MKRYTPAQARKLANRVLWEWAWPRQLVHLDGIGVTMANCCVTSPTRAGRCYAAILNSLAGFENRNDR